MLPPGLHPKGWAELHHLCVGQFPTSSTRADLLTGLRQIVDRLVAEGLVCDVWVDGSFLSEKLDPGDIDLVLAVAPDVYIGGTPEQRGILEWLGSSDAAVHQATKATFGCDTYLFFDAPDVLPEMRSYWLKQFGNDRSGNPKGIAILHIPGGVQ